MSKKQQRISMLIQVHNSINAIQNDAKNQTTKSIEENMSILSESILDILKIDGVGAININEKVGD